MATKLKSYSAMKKSGVGWLGEVPEHWDVLPSRALFAEVKERNSADEQMLSVTIASGVVKQSALLTDGSKKDGSNEDRSSYKLVCPGDIAYNKMRAWQGAVGVSEFRGIVSPAYVVVRPRRELNSRYFHYLLRTPAFAKEAERWSYGITSDMWSLRPEHFKMIYCCVPPVREQAAIVRSLDHVDLRIRRYIRAKQKLIKLLEEQNQTTLYRAVTRGFDSDVCLKSSGVEWFGDVPQHWSVVTMRRVIRRVVDGPHHSPGYVDQGIPFLSARNIKAGRWSLDDAKYISEADYEEFCRRVVPELGDVLYTKGGTTGVARAVDLTFPFQVWVHVAVLKVVKSKVLPEFLAAALNSPRCYEQSQLLTRGATNQDLGLGRIKGIFLALPPLAEQTAILKGVSALNKQATDAIERARQEIVLLKEYRTRLIVDAVTGKVDVRAAAASLPAEPDELEFPQDSDEIGEDVESVEDDAEIESEETEA